MLDKPQAEAIAAAIKETIENIAPDATYVPKYGGEMIEAVAGDAKTQVGGIFAYTQHVSLEFSHGAGFDDPNGHLEGKGKFRRHLKFQNLNDVEGKSAAYFLGQALADYVS